MGTLWAHSDAFIHGKETERGRVRRVVAMLKGAWRKKGNLIPFPKKGVHTRASSFSVVDCRQTHGPTRPGRDVWMSWREVGPIGRGGCLARLATAPLACPCSPLAGPPQWPARRRTRHGEANPAGRSRNPESARVAPQIKIKLGPGERQLPGNGSRSRAEGEG